MATQIKSIITDRQRRDLAEALFNNCACQRNAYSQLTWICGSHMDAQATDAQGPDAWLRRLCFWRSIRATLRAEEFSRSTPQVAS